MQAHTHTPLTEEVLAGTEDEFEFTNKQHLITSICALVLPTEGDDYTPDISVLTFTAGDGPGSSQSSNIAIIDDNLVELIEDFSVEGSLTEATAQFSNGLTNAMASIDILSEDGMLNFF